MTSRCRYLVVALLIALVSLPLVAAEKKESAEERMKRDITYLASDELEGRGITTKGINLAADYIAGEFKKAGLKPAGADGSYFQPFKMSAGTAKIDGTPVLTLKGPDGKTIETKLNDNFAVTGMSGSGKVAADVVFVGYGVTADRVKYDDYKDIDVKGKVVVILRKTPKANDKKEPFDGDRMEQHAIFTTKLGLAEKHKAAAILFVTEHEQAGKADRLMNFNESVMAGETTLPALHIKRAVLDELLQAAAGKKLEEIEAAIDDKLAPQSMPLKGWTAEVEVKVSRPGVEVKNVVGTIEGSGKLANETIVIGAHYDHLGFGGRGSLAPTKKEIHHGADDNGSGTTTVMEVARRLAAEAAADAEKKPPVDRRRFVIMTFTGEEMGLHGSAWYAKHPLFPLADTVAMINLDMVGRLRKDKESGKEKLQIGGTGTAKTFDELVDGWGKKYDLQIAKDKGGYGPSDHSSFYAKKVPVIWLFTGDHPDYHRPSDTADKINVPGMEKLAGLVTEIAETLSTVEKRPEYVEEKSTFGGISPYSGPKIRAQFDYTDDKEGALVAAVVANGPADKGGLKVGDRIVELAGKPVKNIQGYMSLMGAMKKGEDVEFGILRDGKKMTIKVKPE